MSHNNNKHTNSARKFPGKYANFQKISRGKNNSSRLPGFLGMSDTLKLTNILEWSVCDSITSQLGQRTWLHCVPDWSHLRPIPQYWVDDSALGCWRSFFQCSAGLVHDNVRFGQREVSTIKHDYILQASNFCDFHDLNRIAKLNTREFLELPVTISLSA